MKYRISELLNDFEDKDTNIKEQRVCSVNEIKRRTLNRINSENFSSHVTVRHRITKKSIGALVAVFALCLLRIVLMLNSVTANYIPIFS